jgi:hypothetical protein
MKTIKKIKEEVSVLKEEIERSRKFGRTKEVLNLTKKLTHLTDCILYLETKPTKVFITKEIERLHNIISKRGAEIEEHFNAESFQKMSKSELSKLVKKRVAEYNLPKYKAQLETLIYLSEK